MGERKLTDFFYQGPVSFFVILMNKPNMIFTNKLVQIILELKGKN